MDTNKIYCGSALKVLKTFPDESIDMVMTSPPYWNLRDYGVKGQIGLESTPRKYILKLCKVFDEVKRVLKKEGTCWVNMGDTYAGTKSGNTDPNKNGKVPGVNLVKRNIKTGFEDKCLLLIPSRFAIEMCNHGWILRNEIIWNKPNCITSSAKDRFTVDFEKVFFFTKSKKYYFTQQFEPVTGNTNSGRKDGKQGPKYRKDQFGNNRSSFIKKHVVTIRNKRCVWKIPTEQFYGDHYATYPTKLIKTPIAAGCPKNGIILDPFMGSGTTALVALVSNKKFIGIELNPKDITTAEARIKNTSYNLF